MSHDDNLLAEWLKHPGAQVATQRIQETLHAKGEKIARDLLTRTAPIDQRMVDEARGFKQGAEWFLVEAKRGARAFERNQGGETV